MWCLPGIDEDGGNGWTLKANTVKGDIALQWIKNIAGINQKGSLSSIHLEALAYCMNSRSNSSYLASTKLGGASVSKMSLLVTVRAALVIMCCEVFLMPIGLTPRFLSMAMKWDASSGEVHLGSMSVVERHLAVRAKD